MKNYGISPIINAIKEVLFQREKNMEEPTFPKDAKAYAICKSMIPPSNTNMVWAHVLFANNPDHYILKKYDQDKKEWVPIPNKKIVSGTNEKLTL